MSTRELLYQEINRLSEWEMQELLAYARRFHEVPNEETEQAMREVADMKLHPEAYATYTDVDTMMGELL